MSSSDLPSAIADLDARILAGDDPAESVEDVADSYELDVEDRGRLAAIAVAPMIKRILLDELGNTTELVDLETLLDPDRIDEELGELDRPALEDVPGWILDHAGTWHASLTFDGYEHGAPCRAFTKWQTWEPDPPDDEEAVCPVCLDAIEPGGLS